MFTSEAAERRLRRSLLFVPAAEPRKLERARGAGADTVILDLEDAVPPDRKDEARGYVADALRAGAPNGTELAIRINAPGTSDFAADLHVVLGNGGRTLVIPKADGVDRVRHVITAVRAYSGKDASDVRLLLLVESPLAIASAHAIGCAVPGVEALCFGHADFSLEMGLREADASRGVVLHARCALAIAAKACGVAPIDNVHLDVKDEAAFRADAELGRDLGFEGKLCIHPRQAAIANEVYTPGPAEIERALRVVEAAETARTEGRGVFTVDGKMIDAPLVALHRRVLERARRAGAL